MTFCFWFPVWYIVHRVAAPNPNKSDNCIAGCRNQTFHILLSIICYQVFLWHPFCLSPSTSVVVTFRSSHCHRCLKHVQTIRVYLFSLPLNYLQSQQFCKLCDWQWQLKPKWDLGQHDSWAPYGGGKRTNDYFIPDNLLLFEKKAHSLQCFDAVGWAAGRASGL